MIAVFFFFFIFFIFAIAICCVICEFSRESVLLLGKIIPMNFAESQRAGVARMYQASVLARACFVDGIKMTGLPVATAMTAGATSVVSPVRAK